MGEGEAILGNMFQYGKFATLIQASPLVTLSHRCHLLRLAGLGKGILICLPQMQLIDICN